MYNEDTMPKDTEGKYENKQTDEYIVRYEHQIGYFLRLKISSN